jgi:hypothetical protein
MDLLYCPIFFPEFQRQSNLGKAISERKQVSSHRLTQTTEPEEIKKYLSEQRKETIKPTFNNFKRNICQIPLIVFFNYFCTL